MLRWKSAWFVCPECRLSLRSAAQLRRLSPTRASIQSKSRPQGCKSLQISRFSTAGRFREQQSKVQHTTPSPSPHEKWPDGHGFTTEDEGKVRDEDGADGIRASPEEMARAARTFFGESLPQGALSTDEFAVYKRLYGEPSSITTDHLEGEGEEQSNGNVLFRDNEDGSIDEFEYVQESENDQIVDEDAELEENDDDIGQFDSEQADAFTSTDESYFTSAVDNSHGALTFGDVPNPVATKRSKDAILDDIYENWPEEEYVRTHPLTEAGRFGTKPSTLQLPRDSFVGPVQGMVADIANKHLSEAAQKLLGGPGIPDSPSTPAIGKTKGQRPIPLTAFQSKMSPMDANVFVSSIMPQVYASALSTLVECRKRLGSSWLRKLIKKDGGPLILDAGAGGAGIIAFREMLRAEWESSQEESTNAFGKLRSAPAGRATVVAASDSLRHRASELLENTTFIPRLPDYIDPTETETNIAQPRKRYDVIIAPHSLWSLVEEHERRARTQTLWSLLNPDGGVLILIEKGVPRGFEVIASARDLLLSRHIASPGADAYETSVEEQAAGKKERYTEKEKGCIIAPCTNHSKCPLYPVPGISRGRKDWCYFQQNFVRPSYLMSVLQAKARNHDDVEFSYLAVQKGVDQRQREDDTLLGSGFEQGQAARDAALTGFGPPRESKIEEAEEELEDEPSSEMPPDMTTEPSSLNTADETTKPHALSLPRIIPGPLKRKGHILLDVCTPAGTYERWTVRRGMGKQVFRDARKAKWGDLWALGGSSSEPRRMQLGTPMHMVKMQSKRDRILGEGGPQVGQKRLKKEWRRRGREKGKAKFIYGADEAQSK